MGNRIVEFDTKGVHSWKVPGGVHEISVGLWGAGFSNTPYGIVDATFTVTPGTWLVFYVGGADGFNGGGRGDIWIPAIGGPAMAKSTGGGGATDMRIGGVRQMVAGGAGGQSLFYEDPAFFTFIDGGVIPWAQASMPGPDEDTRVPQRVQPGYPITKFAGWSGGFYAGADSPGEVFVDSSGPSSPVHYVMGGGGGGFGGGGTSALFSTDDPIEADRNYLMATSRAGSSWSSQMTPVGLGDGRYQVTRPVGTETHYPVIDGFVHIEYDAGKGGWHLGHVGWGRNQGW